MHRAIEINPEDHFLVQELASVLIEMERYPEAISYLKKIRRTNPDNAQIYKDLGVAYTLQGFYDEAERALLRALKLAPTAFLVQYHLGTLYAVWEGHREVAKAYIKRMVESDDYPQWYQMSKNDRLFAHLRNDPEFRDFWNKSNKK